MLHERVLQRLAEKTAPDAAFARTTKDAMMKRIKPEALLASIASVEPSRTQARSIRDLVLRVIRPEAAEQLSSVSKKVSVTSGAFARIKESVLARLSPLEEVPMIHSSLKWGAAFAVFLLIIRSMPLILLAPPTSAETTVQLLPAGEEVTVFIGGVWQDVTGPQTLQGPAMISTGNARATIILNDDGVFRLAPNTTLKIHDTADHPQSSPQGITATLVRGEVWALGLLPPIVDGLELETSEGTLSLNAGSASVQQDEGSVRVSVYDKGVTFTRNVDHQTFLVAGERLSLRHGGASSIVSLPTSAFTQVWVSDNLANDAVHRAEIAKLQETRRTELAGILPTSFLYPAKRIAEQVDVLFTLTHDGRTEKRIDQANTRLSEAIALMHDGQVDKATIPLTEYSESLIALASDENDNLVKQMITQQISTASTALSVPTKDPQLSAQMLSDAVSSIGAAIPDVTLSSKDIQGYVLVDKLAEMNASLSLDRNIEAAALSYADIRPYLNDLLAEHTGAHPLLQKQARALLVSTASLLKKSQNVTSNNTDLIVAFTTDVSKYLPEERESIEELNDKLDAQVQEIRSLIIKFDSPVSRYNELFHQMDLIISDTSNPNRGLLLRKLKSALPVSLGEYVNNGIKRLGDELR